jgi:hypothetical protein
MEKIFENPQYFLFSARLCVLGDLCVDLLVYFVLMMFFFFAEN